MPYVIDESCVINLNSDCVIDSTKHHLNDAFVIRRGLDLNSLNGCVLERTLNTSIDNTSSPSLGIVGKEIPRSRENVESRFKRNI